MKPLFMTCLALTIAGAIPSSAADLSFKAAMDALRAGDLTTGASMFHDLAEQSDAQAMYNLALLYRNGIGVPQNRELALYWAWRSRLAAEPKAPSLIAHLKGEVTKENIASIHARLMREIQKDAAVQAPKSFVQLALVEEGLAAKPDLVQIYVWYSLAASMGHPNADRFRDSTYAALAAKDAVRAEATAMTSFMEWCQELKNNAPLSCSVPASAETTG